MNAPLVRKSLAKAKSLEERKAEVAEIIIADIAAYAGGDDLLARHLALIDGLKLPGEESTLWKLQVSEEWKARIEGWTTEGQAKLAGIAERLGAAKPTDLIDLAKRAKPKAKIEAPVITKGAFGPFIAGFENVPDAPKPPARASEQERLTYPPSRLLGAAVAHAHASTRYPDRQIALWGALVGMYKILDRRVIGPTESSTVLYNLLLAASGAGKEDGIQFALTCLKSVGYGSLLQAGMVTSVQAVEDIIALSPNCLVILDEFGRFLSLIQDQTGNVSELPGPLCKLWGQKPYGFYPLMRRAGKRDKDDENKQVGWPCLALACCSVSEPFWKACGDDYINSGLLNRFSFFDAGIGATEMVEPTRDPAKLDGWMVEAMRRITRNIAPSQSAVPFLTDDTHLKPWRLTWGPKSKEAYDDFANDIRKLREGRKRDIFIRAPEQAVRYATGAALWDGSTVVGLPHWEWGWSLVNRSCEMLLSGANRNMQVRRDFAEVCDHIKRLLGDGAMKWVDIRKASRSAACQYGMDIVDKAMSELIECGEVREILHAEQIERQLRPPVGAPGRWFELNG